MRPLRALARLPFRLAAVCLWLGVVLSALSPVAKAQHGVVSTLQDRTRTLTVRLNNGFSVARGATGQVRAFIGPQPVIPASFTVENVSADGRTVTCRFITVSMRTLLRTGLDVSLSPVIRWGTLAVTTEPSGAAVSLDGEPMRSRTQRLPPGTYTVRASAEGYSSAQERVTVRPGEPTPLGVVLRPVQVQEGTLVVTTEPSGARVTLDGGSRASTPYTYRVRPGTYTVRVSMEGYRSAQERVEVRPDETTTLPVVLEPLPPSVTGRLRVEAAPEGAQISVGRRSGQTRFDRDDLPVGEHLVLVVLRDHVAAESLLVVAENETTTWSVRLEVEPRPPPDSLSPPRSNRAALILRSRPDSAQVYLDGKFQGSTPDRFDLPPGPVRVRIHRPFHAEFEGTLDLVAGAIRDTAFVLEPKRGEVVTTVGPWGARILADSVPIGHTPLGERLRLGRRALRVERPGFVPYDTTVQVREDSPALVEATLRRAAGWLRVRSDPPGASVVLDGAELGPAPLDVRVPVGIYTVEVRPAAGPVLREEVEVAAGTDRRVGIGPDPTLPEPPRPPRPPPKPDSTSGQSLGAVIDPSVPSEPVARLVAAAHALVREARYAQALDSLAQAQNLDRGNPALSTFYGDVEAALGQISALSPGEKATLDGLRRTVADAVILSDADLVLRQSRRVLALVPGDLSALGLLSEALARTEQPPGGGPPLAFVYVYGAAERQPAVAPEGGPPAAGFLFAATEVTNAHFAAFLNQHDGDEDADGHKLVARRPLGIVLDRRARTWSAVPGRDAHPATDATWHGAQAYARHVGGRLPAAAEWAWAHALGRGAGSAPPEANLAGTAGRDTWADELAPVGGFPPDALGLYDLTGNAAEWTADEAGVRSRGQTRITQGGSFQTGRDHTLRPGAAPVDDPQGVVGFRVLLPVE